ncbi:MAG TPA: M57 family metalloprotease [Kofleriaceae bacterium]|nr:M57 family metalloprotease [Kofleriaceae bacterium]
MLKKSIVFAMTCGATVLGCSAEPQHDSAADTQEIIDNLLQAGFPASEIMVVDGVVYTGRDAEVSLQASREMLEVDHSAGGAEQYRTTNLVSRSLATICVNGAAFTGSFSQGLDMAIANYNALGLTFSMRRTSGSTTGCGATITARISSGTGGSSGFPSGGRPFNTINIGSGLNGFNVNTIEHVITHELGHTIGFRHSDFFNRSISCGTGGNEGDGGVGAILIPGTPSGATVGGSIMNSCFRTVETGEFTSSDITALNALY